MEHRETLLRVLGEFAERAEHEAVTLGQMLDSLKSSAMALSTVLLCLPFLQPLTLGPLSSLGGLVLASFGWQLLRGRQGLWLPRRIHAIRPSPKAWRGLLGLCRWLVGLFARLTRERLTMLVDSRFGERFCGSLIAIGGLLLVIPVPMLPFNNTLPTLGMLFAAVALLERDGLMALVSIFWLTLSTLYFIVFFYALFVLGAEAGDWIQTLLPAWFAGGQAASAPGL